MKIGIKLAAIAASIYGMSRNVNRLADFTFFTNLSNIFIDLVLLASLLYDVKALKKQNLKKSNGFYTIKFMATISITLTFFVYLVLLAPTSEKGLLGAYLSNGCGSLCVHVVTPLLAILDFFLYDYEFRSQRKHAAYATVPPLIYVVFVVILSSVGFRWYGTMYAPYNFLNFGSSTGWFGFDLSLMSSETTGIGVAYAILALLLIFLGLGQLFLAGKNWMQRRKSN